MAVRLHNMSGAISASSLTVAGNTIYPQPDVPADRGWIAWNMPPYGTNGQSTLGTAGVLRVYRIRRVPAGTITSIVVLVTTAGGTLTSGQNFGALFTSAGTLVAQTTDQTTAWGSTGAKTMTLSSPQVVTAGDYYVGLWWNGSSSPQLSRWDNSAGATAVTNAGLSAPNLLAATTADTGLTTTAPSSLGAQTAISPHCFVALA